MDFAFDEGQEALRELAEQVISQEATVARIRAREADGRWYLDSLWAAMAQAELLGVALPERLGGSGMGFLELCVLLEQLGRAVAPVPALETLVCTTLPIVRYSRPEQQLRWLAGVAEGRTLLTAALHEELSSDPMEPATEARQEGSHWRVHGVKTCVPAAHLARYALVPARLESGQVALFVLPPDSPGMSLERQIATHLEPLSRLTLDNVRADASDLLVDPALGRQALSWILERTRVGMCAIQLGLCKEALKLTAAYASTRQQFDRPIATFQAVSQRAADAWIDVEALRAVTWQAAWRLAEELPAEQEVAIARFWACEGGHRALYACQHLHGGIGVDVDYPLHRYYLWTRHLELSMGGANSELARLGALLAGKSPTIERTPARTMAPGADPAMTHDGR